MSDPTTCERCGKSGLRRNGDVAPDGWYFGTFMLSSEGDHPPGDVLVVHACSVACRDALWTRQAGHRWDTLEARERTSDEVRRYIELVARRLCKEARDVAAARWPVPASEQRAAAIVARLLATAASELRERAEAEITARGEAQGDAHLIEEG